MRGLLSLVGLLLVVLVVALLARRALTPGTNQASAPPSSASMAQVATPEQARQVQQQVQDDVNRLMQTRASDVDAQVEAKP